MPPRKQIIFWRQFILRGMGKQAVGGGQSVRVGGGRVCVGSRVWRWAEKGRRGQYPSGLALLGRGYI